MIAKTTRPQRRVPRLYVANLPYGTTDSALTRLFLASGAVESVHVARHGETGVLRDFAFVQMCTEDGARHALAHVDASSYGGRTLIVMEASDAPALARGVGAREIRARQPPSGADKRSAPR